MFERRLALGQRSLGVDYLFQGLAHELDFVSGGQLAIDLAAQPFGRKRLELLRNQRGAAALVVGGFDSAGPPTAQHLDKIAELACRGYPAVLAVLDFQNHVPLAVDQYVCLVTCTGGMLKHQQNLFVAARLQFDRVTSIGTFQRALHVSAQAQGGLGNVGSCRRPQSAELKCLGEDATLLGVAPLDGRLGGAPAGRDQPSLGRDKRKRVRDGVEVAGADVERLASTRDLKPAFKRGRLFDPQQALGQRPCPGRPTLFRPNRVVSRRRGQGGEELVQPGGVLSVGLSRSRRLVRVETPTLLQREPSRATAGTTVKRKVAPEEIPIGLGLGRRLPSVEGTEERA